MALKTFTTADGSANQALVTNGSGVLSFAAVGASAGQVIQVLSATDSTERSTLSTSFVTASNTLSATITPSSASNKILILVDGASDAGAYGFLTVFRGATDLGASSDKGLAITGNNSGTTQGGGLNINFLDSPNTTSAITYQLYMRTNNVDFTVRANLSNSKSSITLLEIKG